MKETHVGEVLIIRLCTLALTIQLSGYSLFELRTFIRAIPSIVRCLIKLNSELNFPKNQI